LKILVLPGDGIGPEITRATIVTLEAAASRFDLPLTLIHDVVGNESHRLHGTTVRPELLDLSRDADGVILGPAEILGAADATKVNPSKFFRKGLDLFANIRPSRTYAGRPGKAGELDLVVVRENTEGFYADRNMEAGNSEILVTPDVAISMRRITRHCCLRIARSACELAMQRTKRLTAAHKANVLKVGDGMFLDACRAVMAEYPELDYDEVLIDSMMAHVVRNPRQFDVIVTTNMFGDILSDLTAELAGSLGLAASLNAGTDHAMAQAAHGSAPDIADKDIANPFSLIGSAGLLLGWYGRRMNETRFMDAERAIDAALEAAIAAGEVTIDVGGRLGTAATAAALAARLRAL
jgi:3-isopropylmalate dehydrogenase